MLKYCWRNLSKVFKNFDKKSLWWRHILIKWFVASQQLYCKIYILISWDSTEKFVGWVFGVTLMVLYEDFTENSLCQNCVLWQFQRNYLKHLRKFILVLTFIFFLNCPLVKKKNKAFPRKSYWRVKFKLTLSYGLDKMRFYINFFQKLQIS